MKKARCEVRIMVQDLEQIIAQDTRFENPRAVQRNTALTLGISERTLRNWRSGKFMPNGYNRIDPNFKDNYKKLKRRVYYYTRGYEYHKKVVEDAEREKSNRANLSPSEQYSRPQILSPSYTPESSNNQL